MERRPWETHLGVAAGAEARQRYDELRGQNAAGFLGAAPFSALLDRFEDMRIPQLAPNTQKAYRQLLEAIRRNFIQDREDLKAHEICPAHVEGFMRWRARTPLGAGRMELRAQVIPPSKWPGTRQV